MKTSFNIAWIDDNFSDSTMNPSSRLSSKLKRKNGFSLVTEDVYAEVTSGDFDSLLSKLALSIDLSNSFDLFVIDYELGNNTTGEKIATKFRTKLPSADILFYSGKLQAQELREIIAKENIDGVTCVGRTDLIDTTYTVIENIINRSHKISTLRGLILNSVCEMDHTIREILCKYSAENTIQMDAVKRKSIQLIRPKDSERTTLERESINDLLNHKRMMSGSLFSVLENIKRNLGLSRPQQSLLSSYRVEILYLRATAAHAKEATCQTTGQSMLTFKNTDYKRGDIDEICKTIVKHENNMQSILDGMS